MQILSIYPITHGWLHRGVHVLKRQGLVDIDLRHLWTYHDGYYWSLNSVNTYVKHQKIWSASQQVRHQDGEAHWWCGLTGATMACQAILWTYSCHYDELFTYTCLLILTIKFLLYCRSGCKGSNAIWGFESSCVTSNRDLLASFVTLKLLQHTRENLHYEGEHPLVYEVL